MTDTVAYSIPEQIGAMSGREVVEIAANALGESRPVQIIKWSAEVLPGESIGNGTLGLFKVHGSASVSGETRPWSAVVKAIDPNATNLTAGPHQHGRRELEAFASGALANIEAGMRAVPSYGITRRSDGTSWLWLRDLSGGSRPPWSGDRYAQIARHIGQFNGFWPEGSHPDGSWLGSSRVIDRRKSIADRWAEPYEQIREQVRHPDLKKAFGATGAERVLRLREDLIALTRATDNVPRSVAHNDCHTENLFLDPLLDQDVTYAIDWASVGLSPIGVDIGSFIGTGTTRSRDQCQAILDHREACFDSYVQGLRDYGWTGKEADVYLAAASIVATYVVLLVPLASSIALEDQFAGRMLKRMETDRPDALEQLAERFSTLIPLLDEALDLID